MEKSLFWCITLRLGLAAALVFGIPAVVRDGVTALGGRVAAAQDAPTVPAVVSHLHRIAGQVRQLFLWAGSDRVGTARITWQQDSTVSAISLLIGSDPQRAPRGLNEWGYLQERVHNHEAEVFGVRTLSDAVSRGDVQAGAGEGLGPQRFGAICSLVTTTTDRARVTTVRNPGDLSYRDLPRLLDALSTSAHWEAHQVARPSDAEPGFLTAFARLMGSSVSGAGPPLSSVAYVYQGKVYDLLLRHSEPTADLRVGESAFHNLIRARYTVRERATGRSTQFLVTYGSEGALAGIPGEAVYQPHWWLRIELSLDDGVDVPVDPASDQHLLRRTQRLCAAAQSAG